MPDATLEAALARHATAPLLSGERRASTDESHRVALMHPLYDGFITVELVAHCDLTDLRLVASPELDHVVTPHHKVGAIGAGQRRPVDVELHPGAIPALGVSGWLRVVDEAGQDAAPPMRLTLATHGSLDCVLAGHEEGPWAAPETLDGIVDELLAGRGGAKRLAARIDAVARGAADPGWSRVPWRRA